MNLQGGVLCSRAIDDFSGGSGSVLAVINGLSVVKCLEVRIGDIRGFVCVYLNGKFRVIYFVCRET